MATTELLLTQHVENLGGEGDQVKVKAGYARNYLLPRGIGIPVNRANKKQIEALHKRRAEREAKEMQDAETTKEKLAATNIAIVVKTGEAGKMFGSVTAQNIIDRLAEDQVVVTKKQLKLEQPIREIGKHTVTIKLHGDISVDFEFEIVSENPIETNEEEAEKSE